ncbi:MAG: hypothetical protein JO279_06770 [Verrucomicrobia bacterium]|nr:hypothetical protein [Verrucomicrobiota bacterium]
MFEIPDPLHPAVVHFPIVLIFLGTLLSILAIFIRRGALPQYTAVALILAAAGAQLAVNTGSDQIDGVLERMPDAKPLILVHAEWGLKTRTAAVIAAVASLVALPFHRFKTFRRVLAFIIAAITVWACFCAFEAAAHGGAMVFHHGVGVAPNGSATGSPPPATTPGDK